MANPTWELMRASYDRSAEGYDAELRAIQLTKYDALVRPEVRAALESGPALDLGCGTGLLAERLASLGWGAKLVGLDLSRGMLLEATGRVQRRVESLTAPLPFREASFGVVAAITVLRIFDAPVEPTLSEVDRVLRPGGWFLASVLAGRDDGSIPRWLEQAGYSQRRVEAGQDTGWIARKA